jgi:hypothetical protein
MKQLARFFWFGGVLCTLPLLLSCGAGQQASQSPFWSQWGANPQHTGMVSVKGQNLSHKLASTVYDQFWPKESNEGEAAHYQAPIIDGNDLYMVRKAGTYTSCATAFDWFFSGSACGPNTWNTMSWNEDRYTWSSGKLVHLWSFASDWKPEPNATNFNISPLYFGLGGFEPVFHAVDANFFLYVPGAAGTLWKVDKAKGTAVSHINPFRETTGVSAANTFVAGPITADSNGNIYYNVIELNVHGHPWNQNDVVNAWLVKVLPGDTTSVVSYGTLVAEAPAGTSNHCPGTFNLEAVLPSYPWPPSPNAEPPTQICGSQRPGLNIAPAVAADGTIYTVSRAHFDAMVAYLVAVNPDLTVKWVASLQNRLNDGCGVLLPIAGAGVTDLPNSCAHGTKVGVDPTTNAPGSAVMTDEASSSPTVLPDGSVVFGAVDNYNFSRGHLFHFDAQGNYLNAFDFGWDSTPGVYAHDGTFSILLKNNHYGSTSYCFGSSPVCASTPQSYFITQLDANLNVEWSFQGTTTDSLHPNGFEWCINMPAVDAAGNVFVNSEDGNIYRLAQGNHGIFTTPDAKMFLKAAIAAAYTPLAIGPDGKLFTLNAGELFVIGN